VNGFWASSWTDGEIGGSSRDAFKGSFHPWKAFKVTNKGMRGEEDDCRESGRTAVERQPLGFAICCHPLGVWNERETLLTRDAIVHRMMWGEAFLVSINTSFQRVVLFSPFVVKISTILSLITRASSYFPHFNNRKSSPLVLGWLLSTQVLNFCQMPMRNDDDWFTIYLIIGNESIETKPDSTQSANLSQQSGAEDLSNKEPGVPEGQFFVKDKYGIQEGPYGWKEALDVRDAVRQTYKDQKNNEDAMLVVVVPAAHAEGSMQSK
jgi:hypothetical protein